MPSWNSIQSGIRKWSLLNDPIGRGMSEVLTATIQNVRAQRKDMKKAGKVIPLDPFHMQSEYTVLSAQLTKLVDKQERAYQKVFLNSICGQGELLNSTNHILNTIEEMGQTHRQHKRKTHSVNKIVYDSLGSGHPWSPLIHQTKLMEQEVPAYFQQGSNLQTQYVNEEEVLQATTCSTKDLQEDMEGWKKAFTNELDSFDRLNVKTDVWENTLDLRKVEILPGKVVMVKKPIGDGTHLKKGRVVVCGNFQQVQPGEDTCANTLSFPMLRTLISLASLQRWAVASWDVSTAFLYAQLPEDHVVYCRPPNALIRLGLVQPGVVWKLNKALYGLRTSPKAWEEERDEKLQNLTWNLKGQQVGLCKVDSTNCVWTIRERTTNGFQGEPLGMVIAYVDDLIAVGQQEQLDGMKASLDALYTMKTSGTVPAEYTPGTEPLKFLGCFIERISTGEIIMHQRSYIEHCLKNNEMTQLKVAKSLPCVDEKSPPEDAFDEHGHPTSFEEDKSMCQKYIGQLMWLTTRTRPDIAAVLGRLLAQAGGWWVGRLDSAMSFGSFGSFRIAHSAAFCIMLSWTQIIASAEELCASTIDESQQGPKSLPSREHMIDVARLILRRAEGCAFSPSQARESISVDENRRDPLRKRSWRRAVRRAIKYGTCRYRGQWLKKSQVLSLHHHVQECHASPVPRPCCPVSPSRPPRQVRGPPLQYLSYNSGGLSVSRMDEILAYSSMNDIKVVLLQETRRTVSMNWTSESFHIVQSAASKSQQGGVTVAVSMPSALIHYEEVLPGHILRVRVTCPCMAVPLELINVYQVPASGPASLEGLRQDIWHALHALLPRIPKRNYLILAGDFNVSIPALLPHVSQGDPLMRVSGDSDSLMSLLSMHELWLCICEGGKGGATFRSYTGSLTRIDYVFLRATVRRRQTQGYVDWDAPFLGIDNAGQHGVLRGRVLTSWHPTPRPTLPYSGWDRELLTKAQMTDDSLRRSFLDKISASLSGIWSLDELNECLRRHALQCFARRPQRRVPPWCNQDLRDLCVQKWAAYRKLKMFRHQNLSCFFQAWSEVVKVLMLTTRCQKMARKLRRQYVVQACVQAREAFDSGNVHQFWQQIRLLSPKKILSSKLIRKFVGNSSSNGDEGDLLASHFHELFASPCDNVIPRQHTWHWQQPPRCDHELARCLDRLPLHKAVPRDCCGGAVWKIALALPHVRQVVDHCVEQMDVCGVPSLFTDGDLILLAKPNKSGKEPSHYRPLVLQCPLGKSILAWAAAEIANVAALVLRTMCQFAYLAGRTVEQAIFRVSTFIGVRRMLMPQSPSIALRQAGWKGRPCSGLCVAALDLQQAFDCVDRDVLMQALSWFQVQGDVYCLVRAWYTSPSYRFRHGEREYKIVSGRGVRQGCSAAPILWNVYLHFVIMLLCVKYPEIPWQEYLTIYADDICVCLAINEIADVSFVVKMLRLLFEHLSLHKLLVNFSKTFVLFRVSGKSSRKACGIFVVTKQGQRYLRISEHCDLLIVRDLEYLGVKLSLGSCTKSVSEWRMRKSKASFSQLRTWWCCAYLSLRQRVQLYKAVIVPTLMHGLGAFGISPTEAQRLDSMTMKHLRRIAKSPVHITRESNADLAARVQFMMPSVLVNLACLRLLAQLVKAVSDSVCPCYHLDALVRHHIATKSCWFLSCEQGIRLVASCHGLAIPSVSSVAWLGFASKLRKCHFQVPFDHGNVVSPAACKLATAIPLDWHCACGKSFSSFGYLKAHWTRSPECAPDTTQVHSYEPGIDCQNNLPVCYWCGQSFRDFRGLARHCSLGRCSSNSLRQSYYDSMIEHPKSEQHVHVHVDLDLCKHCCLCRQWCETPHSLILHIRRLHLQQYKQARLDYSKLETRTSLYPGNQCLLCGSFFEKLADIKRHVTQQCVVRLQTCIMGFPDQARFGAATVEVVPSVSARVHSVGHALPAPGRTQGCVGRSSCSTSKEIPLRRRLRGKQREVPARVEEEEPVSSYNFSGEFRNQFRSTCSAASATSTSSGRTASDNLPQFLFRDSSGTFRVGGRCSDDRCEQAVESGDGVFQVPGQREPPGCVVQTSFRGLAFSSSDGFEEGQESLFGESRRQASVLRDGVGHSQRSTSSTQRRTSSSPRTSHQTSRRHSEGHLPGVDREGQSLEATRELSQRHCLTVLDYPLGHASARATALYAPLDNVQHELLESVRCHIQARSREISGAGGDYSQASLSQEQLEQRDMMLTTPCRLINSCNSCYLNSFAQCMAWTFRQASLLGDLPADWRAALELLHRSDTSIDLTQQSAWRTVLADWRLGAHEDVAELATHVFTICPIVLCQFPLNIRRRRVDSGHAFASHTSMEYFLTLPLANFEHGCSINELLAEWTLGGPEQDRVLHLIAPSLLPRVLIIQLSRFYMQDNRVIKNRMPVRLSSIVHVPVWNDMAGYSVDTHLEPYRLVGAVLHHGSQATQGHYTAWIANMSGTAWHCDDERPTRLVELDIMLGATVQDACLLYLIPA